MVVDETSFPSRERCTSPQACPSSAGRGAGTHGVALGLTNRAMEGSEQEDGGGCEGQPSAFPGSLVT